MLLHQLERGGVDDGAGKDEGAGEKGEGERGGEKGKELDPRAEPFPFERRKKDPGTWEFR
ncbi:hypothetical protein MMC21_001907 [Puttea exsequens]|nr:hypothetical protein [Puttea exsequens]